MNSKDKAMPLENSLMQANLTPSQTTNHARRYSGLALAWVASIGLLLAAALAIASNVPALSQAHDDEVPIAKSLATMLRAGRTVISRNQDRINDSNLGNKGLDGKTVLAESIKIYQEATNVDPRSINPKSRHGKLIQMQMGAIVEVMDAHQQTINRQGVGFKGFIPSLFARLVNEAFGRRAAGNAEVKLTAPPKLIRNARARPDQWEAEVIRDKLLSSAWPHDQSFAAVAQNKGKPAYRTAVPEYYGRTCLTCHGSPMGEIDITGYPKDGASEGDLGGVISITLYR
jgi:hypothetical protein